MGLKQHMVNHVLCLLPETRCYSLKVRLFRFAGVKVARGARLTSSIRVIGAMSLAIGEDSFIGHHVLLAGGPSRIRIGRYVDIAPRVCIVAGTHEIDMRGDHSAGEGKSGDITIEDGVWIGANATILSGVTIGRKSIIGAGSVVNRSIPAQVIAVGNPCYPIKRWDEQARSWHDLRSTAPAPERR
jgi:acetyltransferase-like isoleucine patch superfamily enzyme